MRKMYQGVLIAFIIINIGGCATPKKQRVKPPVVNQISTQDLPGYAEPDYTQQTDNVEVEQPPSQLFDIKELEDEIVVEDIETNLPSMRYINDRIFEYGRKLEQWKELDSQAVAVELADEDAAQMVRCFRRLQNVLNGYTRLHSRMLQAEKMTTAVQLGNNEIFELQKNDIAFLEDSCGRLLADSDDQSVGWDQREEGADLAQLETLIDRYATSGEYEEVLQVWMKIPEFQLGRVHFRTKIAYGNALKFLHQEENAAKIFQEVVDHMSDSDEQATDLVSLRKLLADLYTASGNYEKARSQYRQISEDYLSIGKLDEWSKLQLSILEKSLEGSPELTAYSSILKNYLGYIPQQDGYKIVWQAEEFLSNYPYSSVATNVDNIKDKVTEKADKWFNTFMQDVEVLGSKKNFEEALELLQTLPVDIISADKQIIAKEKNQELLLAEAVENETEKMAKIQELQHQWNNGMLLAKAARYDESIAVFTSLLDTEYAKKAEKKIQDISLEAAKNDRKKAANFFLRYNKTSDLESRKKLLIESRKLLKNIIINYPQVEIIPKVRANIKRVEQEMLAIDPMLIQIADMQEEQGSGRGTVNDVFAPSKAQQNALQQSPLNQ